MNAETTIHPRNLDPFIDENQLKGWKMLSTKEKKYVNDLIDRGFYKADGMGGLYSTYFVDCNTTVEMKDIYRIGYLEARRQAESKRSYHEGKIVHSCKISIRLKKGSRLIKTFQQIWSSKFRLSWLSIDSPFSKSSLFLVVPDGISIQEALRLAEQIPCVEKALPNGIYSWD